jgi:hypothetical protein
MLDITGDLATGKFNTGLLQYFQIVHRSDEEKDIINIYKQQGLSSE